MVGTERIMANSAGDWGKSDPLAVPELILEMKRRGHAESVIRKVVYENPLASSGSAIGGRNGTGASEVNKPPQRRRRPSRKAATCPRKVSSHAFSGDRNVLR